MEAQLLYRDLAHYYDLIYSWKDYAKEASILKGLISEYKESSGNRLLDVACGTGHHTEHLRDDYACTGVDVNEEVLEIAREHVENVEFIRADMTTLNLGKKFDVITCLFSSIGYVKTYPRLRKTLQNFARHLVKGGVALIEPFFTKDVYLVGSPFMTTYDGDDVKIARLNVSEIDGDVSVMEMHYLIAEKGVGVRHFVDRHEVGLFEIDETLEIMGEAGFDARFLREGALSSRGLYVGLKR